MQNDVVYYILLKIVLILINFIKTSFFNMYMRV
jgi:hypothetical protein